MADIYVVFDPKNVKSADPVTYDDNGNIIPLSERFNESQADIRYSDRDTIEKGKKRYYNEFNSLAMQWANSVGTEQGDYNRIYDSKSQKWCLAVADKNSDGGYRILTVGNYKEVKELEQLYNAENEGFDRYVETYKSIKRTSDNGLWESPNREMFGRNNREIVYPRYQRLTQLEKLSKDNERLQKQFFFICLTILETLIFKGLFNLWKSLPHSDAMSLS